MATKIYDVVVIGGGASGMIAAISAARRGATVLIVEKNKRLGKKLRITGGGRCNIWNEEYELRLLLANYGSSEKFLYAPFARFGLRETIEFFHTLGIDTKVENRKRAFPISERAEDVAEALVLEITKLKIDIAYEQEVIKLVFSDEVIYEIVTKTDRFKAKSYVLSTGGSSKPETGSTGDGFKWLKELGHKIAEPTPTITPLAVREQWIKDMSGVTLKDISITFLSEGVKAFKINGDVLCTHFGISGPLILNNAWRVADLLQAGKVTARIDLHPAKNHKELDIWVINTLKEHKTKQLKNVIRFITLDGTASAVVELLKDDINLEVTASEVTKDDRKAIVHLLKSMQITITNLMGFDKAVVADGGINLAEIDTRTMQSRNIKNLFITGDLLNINRPSGGYSLQLCWTTGYIAGESAALEVEPN